MPVKKNLGNRVGNLQYLKGRVERLAWHDVKSLSEVHEQLASSIQFGFAFLSDSQAASIVQVLLSGKQANWGSWSSWDNAASFT